MCTTATSGSLQSMLPISFQPSVVTTWLCGFIMTFHVNLWSLQVSEAPSCHLMFGRSLYFNVRPSLLTSPFAIVGISRTASGTGRAFASYRTVQEKMNIPRSSVGEAEFKAGLRFLGSENSENRKMPGCVQG